MAPPMYRGRFAPSPTGPLHFGSLVAALASWLRARQHGGVWVVRVEDLDPPREIRGAANDQLKTLQAFGMESDEPVLQQSQRHAHYERALLQLIDDGLAFECRCSRNDLVDQDGIHRRCTGSAKVQNPALRARVPNTKIEFLDHIQGRYEQCLADSVGDFVMSRVEGFHAYQLAVVVDDAAQRITEVVRGRDLLDSTPRQIWLQRALGYATPTYLHLPLALDSDGRKLSKSLAALPLDRDDPLPSLRAAWAFLGQDVAALQAPRTVEAWLRAATVAFDCARIPNTAELALAIPAARSV